MWALPALPACLPPTTGASMPSFHHLAPAAEALLPVNFLSAPLPLVGYLSSYFQTWPRHHLLLRLGACPPPLPALTMQRCSWKVGVTVINLGERRQKRLGREVRRVGVRIGVERPQGAAAG